MQAEYADFAEYRGVFTYLYRPLKSTDGRFINDADFISGIVRY